MHGLIFTGFRAFTQSEYPKIAPELWRSAPRYLATGAYADEDFEVLVARAVELSKDSRRTLLRRFGIFTSLSTFRLLYPDYYASHSDTFGFLLDVEEQIHETVRRTVPDSAPPRLDIVDRGDAGLSITYTSPRQLCDLLDGLVVGVSRFYGDSITIEHPLCMNRGDAAGCTFFVSRA